VIGLTAALGQRSEELAAALRRFDQRRELGIASAALVDYFIEKG
jgi:hypothetical protein